MPDLERLVEDERNARIEPDALRRLSVLLPADAAIADKVASRLKLSNKARKRLACSADRDTGPSARALAYRVGPECAVDRLLLARMPADAAAISEWTVPRLPIGGGTLIARGLKEGPVVARTLRTIEQRWVEEGFPSGDALEAIVSEEMSRTAPG